MARRASLVNLSRTRRLWRLRSCAPSISFCVDEMAKIRARERAAGVAVAAVFERRQLGGEAGVAQVQPRAAAQERRARARQARGQHAVEHVDAAADDVDDAHRVADAHEVAQAVGGQQVVHELHRGEHLVAALADAEAADGVGVEADVDDLGRRAAPQLLVGPTLHDADQELVAAAVRVLAGRRPARGALHGGFELRARQRAGRALVEGHDHVRAELLLYAHRQLGREHVAGAVVHGAELDAVVAHDPRALEAEDLEAAGVGEDRPVPPHEPVQAAVRGDDLRAGAEVQVVRVAEDDLGAELPQLARLHGLDRRLGPDGHEAGRLDHAVGRHETTGASGSVARLHGEGEALGAHLGAGRGRACLRPVAHAAHSASMASPKL